MLPRKAAAGAERGSLEPGHASLPGLAGRQLAAGIRRPVPAHKSVSVALLVTTEGSALLGGLPHKRERRAWSFELASDRRFEARGVTSSNVAFSCSSSQRQGRDSAPR